MTDCVTSSSQIARDVGVSLTTISRLRSGQRLPSRALMQRFKEQYVWSDEDIGRWNDAIEQGGGAGSAEWLNRHLL